MEQARKQPDQDIYDLLYKTCLELGYTVYGSSPPKGARYPYVRIGAVQIVPQATKSYLVGKLFIYFDVFGTKYQRKLVSQMAANILKVIGGYRVSPGGYNLGIVYNNSGWSMLVDRTTEEDLVFAQANAEFNFN